MASPTLSSLRSLTDEFLVTEAAIRDGGGKAAIDRQHEKGRLTARERIALLVDRPSGSGQQTSGKTAAGPFQELGLWAAHEMYKEFGGAPAAGVVTGIGVVQGRRCMIIANDATVKAGAFFPMTCKKIIRAQQIAMMARLPLIYLVDSAGVFLPMQEDVFPDTDDFGRIFRHNAVMSAMGIPQIAAIMGYCVAGGGYLPVLCDTLIMTEGSGLYLAGPALVKAAIGQEVTDEELGGAAMHASISGTIDFKEKTDEDAIERVRSLVSKYGDSMPKSHDGCRGAVASSSSQPFHDVARVYDHFTDKPGSQYDAKEIIACIVDAGVSSLPPGGRAGEGLASAQTKPNPSPTPPPAGEGLCPDFDEYKADYGQSLVCGYAKIGGHPCGIVANQKKIVTRTMPGGKTGPSKAVQMPGVIYDDSADKAARFIMDCNQRKIPIVFLHDTTGFMVGRDSEQGGIIRAGAKMVNAMANCVVPKIVVIVGGSYGAGNYAMCGRAFDQFLSFAWPNAKCAVMGANQATGVLTQIEEASRKRKGETIDAAAHEKIYGAIHAAYTEQADIRHAASRGWLDRIIEPHRTREELIAALDAANQGWDYSAEFKTGVLQT
ncbi:MAG TPA: acyl-CoA carboxylase subunit beta [Phycisphaerales bacterium]|nr:acyl-CoA carboxylase subunit beta [Phycisphaerales bacterium]